MALFYILNSIASACVMLSVLLLVSGAEAFHFDAPNLLRMTFWCMALLGLPPLGKMLTRYVISDAQWLGKTIDDLSSSSRRKQRRAISLLSFALGNRFGFARFMSRKRHDLCCRLWKNWWRQNQNQVVWYPELGMCVERGLLTPNEDH
jgi:hypothetical protein